MSVSQLRASTSRETQEQMISQAQKEAEDLVKELIREISSKNREISELQRQIAAARQEEETLQAKIAVSSDTSVQREENLLQRVGEIFALSLDETGRASSANTSVSFPLGFSDSSPMASKRNRSSHPVQEEEEASADLSKPSIAFEVEDSEEEKTAASSTNYMKPSILFEEDLEEETTAAASVPSSTNRPSIAFEEESEQSNAEDNA